jgi:hypothetical protein
LLRQQNYLICRYFSEREEPSDGLEPSTPPYHGGLGLLLADVGNALDRAPFLQSGWFLPPLHSSLEGP